MNQPKIHFIGNNIFSYSDIQSSTLEDCINYLSNKKIIGLDIETSRKYPKGKYPDTDKDVYKAGLDPYLSRVVMIQVGDLENVFVIDSRQFDKNLQPLFDLLHWRNDLIVVGHNLKFEGKHLHYNYGLRLNQVWDTMLCEINLTNGLQLGYSLADLAVRYLGLEKSEDVNLFNYKEHLHGDYMEYALEQVDKQYIDKSIRMGFLNIGDTPFTEAQIKYGVNDIIYPLLIRNKQLQSKYNPIVCHKLENNFSQVLADLELKGMYFDSNKWLEIYKNKLPIYNQLKNKLDKWVIKNVPKFTGTADLFNNQGTCTVQWTSSKQVIDLFKHLGFCPKEKSKQTKRMEYTVGDKALFKLLDKDHKKLYYSNKSVEIVDTQTLILVYLKFKKIEQACTTFGKDWLKYVHPITKRVHSNYKQILNTGRISSTSPNLQNIPSSKEYRECFTAPKGFKIVNADYAAQEIRVLAEVSKVKDMQDFFVKGDDTFGDDFHSFTATKMFRIIYNDKSFVASKKTPTERDSAKAINFKINYGGSAYTLKDDFGVSEEEAEKFIENYLDAFPGLREDFKKTKEFAVKNGYVVIDNFTNRRWFFKDFEYMKSLYKDVMKLYPDNYKEMSKQDKEIWKSEHKHLTSPYWKKYFTLKSKLERTSLNYRIQGLSGGMTKLACILLRNWLIENNIENAYLNNVIHDETNSECLDDEVLLKVYSKKVEECMEKAGTYFCQVVPMKAEAVIGDYWSH